MWANANLGTFVFERAEERTNIEPISTLVAVFPLYATLFVRQRMENFDFDASEITHASHTIYWRHCRLITAADIFFLCTEFPMRSRVVIVMRPFWWNTENTIWLRMNTNKTRIYEFFGHIGFVGWQQAFANGHRPYTVVQSLIIKGNRKKEINEFSCRKIVFAASADTFSSA